MMRLDQERARRANLDPMQRYYEHHEHLLLGSLSVRVTKAPAASPPAVPAAEEPAPEAPEMTPKATDAERARHCVCVFPPEPLTEAVAALATLRTQEATRLKPALTRAARGDGWRSVPWAGPDAVEDPFAGLGPELSNFSEVLAHLRTQWALARRTRCAADARIDPILLAGPPGVGKSHFAPALADLIGVRMSVFSAGTAQDAMQLCGSDARWANTRPGIVFDLLAQGDSAAPVLVVDEIDKLTQESGGSRDTPIHTLLDLLEEDSARRYRDMSLQLEMDASKVIVIATANERERISSPLLSRLTEFHIAPPTMEQRRLILEGYLAALLESHNCPAGITLDEGSTEVALATPDLDVRALLRMVRTGFATALAAESDRVFLAPPRRSAAKQRIGFI